MYYFILILPAGRAAGGIPATSRKYCRLVAGTQWRRYAARRSPLLTTRLIFVIRVIGWTHASLLPKRSSLRFRLPGRARHPEESSNGSTLHLQAMRRR
jgi:hypothetical protein